MDKAHGIKYYDGVEVGYRFTFHNELSGKRSNVFFNADKQLEAYHFCRYEMAFCKSNQGVLYKKSDDGKSWVLIGTVTMPHAEGK